MTPESRPFVSPRQIASWYLPELRNEGEPPVSIPKLQRGLVWKPAQVELLWDSLFRGLPVGSLVVSKAVQSQQLDDKGAAELHLLDGQQRSNAIATGFTAPDFANASEAKEAIIWIDLSNELIPENSTRQFLFRLTKQAHPWGYNEHDNCGRLSAHAIRSSVATHKKSTDRRPTPAQILPHRAKLPVPLAWLLNIIENEDNVSISSAEVIQILIDRSEHEAPHLKLHKLLTKAKNDSNVLSHVATIIAGCRLALSSSIVLIQAPEELIKGTDATKESDLANLELLFQRLNTQGTPLSGEELTYSMIKAYFPEVTRTIDSIREHGHLRMRASRMVTLAVRAALTQNNSPSLHRGYDLRRLRMVMRDMESEPEEHQAIKDTCLNEDQLPSYCATIDNWLLQDSLNSQKLPPFLLVNLAAGSPQIYLLLLKWAEYHHASPLPDDLITKLPGLVTLLRWFNFKIDPCCDSLFSFNGTQPTLRKTTEALEHCIDQGWLIRPQKPEDYSQFIGSFDPVSLTEDAFKQWSWWQNCIQQGDPEQAQQREQKWHHFHERVKSNREMLIYAQRSFFWRAFNDYDQSDGDYWEDHNRPWDYDHLLAQNHIKGRHSHNTPFKKVSRQWIDTIGNLWACPFEDNRSYGSKKLSAKESETFDADAILTEPTKPGFDHGRKSAENEDAARAFCTSAKERIIQIYSSWFTTVKDLLITYQSP